MTEPRTDIVLDAAARLRDLAAFNRLGGYDPYPFQRVFHRCASGQWRHGSWEPERGEAKQILLSAGNRAGKTKAGGADVAIHACGLYPSWWDGPDLTEVLRRHPLIWCGGVNNDDVRDICQAELCGDPNDPEAWGTGWIPRDHLMNRVLKQGVRNGYESVTVRHTAGFTVTIAFKSYEAGLLDWAGRAVSLVWLDEEPPQKIYAQCVTRTLDTSGLVKMTFTPEKGATDVVASFLTALKPGQLLMLVSLDDARHDDGRTHLNDATRRQIEATYLPHEREMRIRGLPVLGSGSVFPLALESIMCDPFPIPATLHRICGMDFGRGGINHPTAAVWLAWDPDARRGWVYDCYRSSAPEPAVHAAAIKGPAGGMSGRAPWIPVAWPHDGHRAESYASEGVARTYRDLGLNMLHSHAVNPEDGTINREPGIHALYQAMVDGRLQVFSQLVQWHEEFRMYHRDENGRIVDRSDDLMSATRIAFISRAKARAADTGGLHARPDRAYGAGQYNPLEGL